MNKFLALLLAVAAMLCFFGAGQDHYQTQPGYQPRGGHSNQPTHTVHPGGFERISYVVIGLVCASASLFLLRDPRGIR